MQTKDADPHPNLLNGGGPQGRGYVFPALKPEGVVEIPSGRGSESASGSFLLGEADAAAAVASDLASPETALFMLFFIAIKRTYRVVYYETTNIPSLSVKGYL